MKTKILDKDGIFKGRLSIVLILTCLIVLMAYAMSSTLMHTSTADLQPEWSPANQDVDYTVTINNTGGDTIDEVRIYQNPQYVNFDCKNKTGWRLVFVDDFEPGIDLCWYFDEPDTIPAGESDDFEFSAKTPAEGCEWEWKFETRDVNKMWQFIYDNTSVDDLAPNITKTVTGPQSGPCPPGDGEVCWITQSTQINISVVELGVCGVSGLDYCNITYTVDGGAPVTKIDQDLDGNTSWNYSMTFDEDSVHVLNVTCADIAGNKIEDIETFKVDSTPPETNKTYGNPHYPPDINTGAPYPHWITTSTPVTLTYVDPDPTGYGCNIGVDKTWYINLIVDDYYCAEECVPVCDLMFYNHECIQDVQEYCADWDSMGYGSWGDCVENESANNCDLGCHSGGDVVYNDGLFYKWQLYTGPFNKTNESCHIIQYFSVDDLGNVEPMKTQCVFVDDTPPNATKVVGDPKLECEIGGEGYCDGTPDQESCSVYSEDQCLAIPGCNWRAGEPIIPIGDFLAYWKLDGNLLDSIGTNHGIAGGDVTPTAGQVNQGYAFDGDGDYIDINPVIGGRSDWTWSGWIYPDSPGWLTIYSEGDYVYFEIYIDNENIIVSMLNGMNWLTVSTTGSEITLNQWNHVTITLLGGGVGTGTLKIYVDGQEVANGTGQMVSITPDAVIGYNIGRLYGQFPHPGPSFSGTLDEVAIFNRALSASEIMTLYINGYYYHGGYDYYGYHCAETPTSCEVVATNWPTDPEGKCEETLGCNWVGGEGEPEECWWVRDHVTEINLTCDDQDPHPVDHEEVCYRVSLDSSNVTDQYCNESLEDGWCCVDSPKTIIFEEDSLHDLEYYCRDALGNANEPDLEYFRVDSQPPIINKTIIGPQVGDCPPEEGEDCWIKDWTCGSDGTTIHVDAYDDDTYGCAVDNITCTWWYYLDGSPPGGAALPMALTPPFNITFYDETEHELHIKCCDALGNCYEDNETFYVDSSPPETTKWYEGPQKCLGENCTAPEWISSQTLVHLNASDNPDAPCAVGVNETYWRNIVLENESDWGYCYLQEICDQWDPDNPDYENVSWNEYTGPFTKPEESCHIIEYRSVDLLGNSEDVKWQCVFVDNTPPMGNKTVSDPKIPCIPPEPTTSLGGSLGGSGDTVTLYVIANNQGDPNLLEAYNVEANGSLTYIMTYNIPYVANANGAVGTALDTVNDQLFVTFEFVGEVYIFDANNFNPIGNFSTGASDLAGCFVDPNQGYLYVADRGGPNVYVYNTSTYSHIATYNTGLGIMGMAFDHNNNRIYVADYYSSTVYEYNTTMGLLNTYSLPNNNVGIAVDSRNPADVYLYTTTWYSSPDAFTKYRINDGTSNQSGTIPDPAGIAVHPTDDYVYITSGWSYSLRVYDSATMTEIQNIPMPGTCTDLFVGEVVFVPYCGDGNLDAGEECDDGKHCQDGTSCTEDSDCTGIGDELCQPRSGDGCDENCQIEVPEGPDCWWVRDNVTEITLDCIDAGPHPVEQEEVCYRVSFDLEPDGYITDEYCEEFGGQMTGNTSEDWCCAYVGEDGNFRSGPYSFVFMEDSLHDLEFYCRDHLGNTEQTTDLEYFKVDSTPPNTTKTYHGPYHEDNGTEWIDTASTINLTAVDGGLICAVGGVSTYYHYELINDMACYNSSYCVPGVATGEYWTEYTGEFGIPTESCHIIEFYSEDALGNEEDIKWQCVFVDKTPPGIYKDYHGPYFEENDTEWISSETNISIYASDSGLHPSGLKELSYRITLVGDGNCTNDSICQETEGSGSWTTVYTNVTEAKINEQSCHLIEIRAIDNVDKESLHKQCVFVDNTPPTPNKTVGEPKTIWDGQDAIFYDIADLCWNGQVDEIDCWKVTLTTPVSLACVDPEPHPVDHEIVCFNIEVDAEDHTEEYCNESYYDGEYNESGDGFCCLDYVIEDFIFLEETEHNLKYYCVDALDNKGPVDEEKFKVEGEPFEIQINKKWNLISVPFMLINDDIEEVLKDVEDSIEAVWTFDSQHQICGQDWCVYTPDGNPGNDNLHYMIPGWGYWVLATENDMLLIGGSEMRPAVTPPSRILYEGWNLIGYHGTDNLEGYYGPIGNGRLSYCALYTLRNEESIYPPTKWSALSTYWEPDNPYQWYYFGVCDGMDPGAGYWVYMDEQKGYTRSTVCPDGLVEMVCGVMPP